MHFILIDILCTLQHIEARIRIMLQAEERITRCSTSAVQSYGFLMLERIRGEKDGGFFR
jgi:hypothetical protein